MDLKDVIKKTNHARYHYSDYCQTFKTIEELGELIAALSRYKNPKERVDEADVIDELADGLIMILQMWHVFGFDKCRGRMEYKLYELDKRIMQGR